MDRSSLKKVNERRSRDELKDARKVPGKRIHK